MPNHFLNQCWLDVIWTIRDDIQWNLDQSSWNYMSSLLNFLSIFENDFCKMTADLGRDIFCLKTFDTFTRTSECFCPRTVNSSNVNFTSKISIPPKPAFKTWDSKCVSLIAQMVRAFGMNPKVGGFESLSGRDIQVSKKLTLSQEHPFVCRKWMLLPAHSQQFKC